MSSFKIVGGKPLSGEIRVQGSKNATLPALAASLLTTESIILSNVPQILDVQTMLKILKDLGAEVHFLDPHRLEINTKDVTKTAIDPGLARKLRASVLFVGPLIARFGKATLPHPGGDIIGRRPLDTHLELFRGLGIKVTITDSLYHFEGKPKPAKIFLDEVSVTATENGLLATSLTNGTTIITPAASEPHIINLAQLLKKMGAEIKDEGTHQIEIKGAKNLKGAEHEINPDEIEAGSWAIAAAVTGGKIKLTGLDEASLDCIIHKLKQMNVPTVFKEGCLEVNTKNKILPAKIQVDFWPRIPTDLQSQFAVLATQAEGKSLIHDWLYEKRFNYLKDLAKMRAKIVKMDPHRIFVFGPTKLKGAEITSPDIRAGISLVIAALAASGETIIKNAELIDRGYESIEKRLTKLGAKIERIDKKS